MRTLRRATREGLRGVARRPPVDFAFRASPSSLGRQSVPSGVSPRPQCRSSPSCLLPGSASLTPYTGSRAASTSLSKVNNRADEVRKVFYRVRSFSAQPPCHGSGMRDGERVR
jgi:hypothetical protein